MTQTQLNGLNSKQQLNLLVRFTDFTSPQTTLLLILLKSEPSIFGNTQQLKLLTLVLQEKMDSSLQQFQLNPISSGTRELMEVQSLKFNMMTLYLNPNPSFSPSSTGTLQQAGKQFSTSHLVLTLTRLPETNSSLRLIRTTCWKICSLTTLKMNLSQVKLINSLTAENGLQTATYQVQE